ncbi:hypothetical protein [Jiella mangrovi]|uniref:Uncharacterized protein n=1 Tax=Jiella mangrovi TaxID=2821407 RepID=A0ABS4BMG3_9HYPH|nr:hypothetical protein [Jiella mangrovi]MBP0617894.1 hypothetical protein [Jiella mangrovi]
MTIRQTGSRLSLLAGPGAGDLPSVVDVTLPARTRERPGRIAGSADAGSLEPQQRQGSF